MGKTVKRDCFFDFIKAFAIFLVMNDHFVAYFAEEYYQIIPFKQLFGIFYGKFGVSLFAIVSGFFSYRSGKKGTDSLSYVIKRYSFFFCSCLITNLLYYLFNINGLRDLSSIGMVVGESLSLGDFYCPSFWFIRDFFLGCIISFKMGKWGSGLEDSLIIAFFAYVYGFTFIASVISGVILYHITEKEHGYFNSFVVKVILFTVISYSAFYRFENTNIRYTSNTIRALSFILFIYGSSFIRKISDNRIITAIGSRTLAILTSHFACIFFFLSFKWNVPIAIKYILWFITSIILSVPVDFLARTSCRYMSEYLLKLGSLIRNKIKGTFRPD